MFTILILADMLVYKRYMQRKRTNGWTRPIIFELRICGKTIEYGTTFGLFALFMH